MTYAMRQVPLSTEERAYLLKLMQLDLHYCALLAKHSRISEKTKLHHLFLQTLAEKLDI